MCVLPRPVGSCVCVSRSVSLDKRRVAMCVCIVTANMLQISALVVVEVAQTKLRRSSFAPSKEFHPVFKFR